MRQPVTGADEVQKWLRHLRMLFHLYITLHTCRHADFVFVPGVPVFSGAFYLTKNARLL